MAAVAVDEYKRKPSIPTASCFAHLHVRLLGAPHFVKFVLGGEVVADLEEQEAKMRS